MTDQLYKLIFKFLKEYGVSISKHEIEQTIYTHPDYPSIRCISDALDSWKVTINKIIFLLYQKKAYICSEILN